MLSTAQFRQNLYSVFNILVNTGSTFEVVHKKVVYDVTIRRTDKKPTLTRAKRVPSHELVQVDTSVCKKCDTIMFNQVCMNTKCSASRTSAQESSD